MKFCPNCGKLLKPTRKGHQLVYVCPGCGQSFESNGRQPQPQVKTKHGDPNIVDYTYADHQETLPKTKAICPKCGNTEAFWWMQQTRSGDEASTRFMKCTKCEAVWREYD